MLARWMDAVPVIRQRHPEIAERLVAEFDGSSFSRAAVDAQRGFTGITGSTPIAKRT